MKTSELIGPALDWAVAKCEGSDYTWMALRKAGREKANYSTNWAQGGPIIEREKLEITWLIAPQTWYVAKGQTGNFGPTPLIAAMRCYVASTLGDEVDIPEEL